MDYNEKQTLFFKTSLFTVYSPLALTSWFVLQNLSLLWWKDQLLRTVWPSADYSDWNFLPEQEGLKFGSHSLFSSHLPCRPHWFETKYLYDFAWSSRNLAQFSQNWVLLAKPLEQGLILDFCRHECLRVFHRSSLKSDYWLPFCQLGVRASCSPAGLSMAEVEKHPTPLNTASCDVTAAAPGPSSGQRAAQKAAAAGAAAQGTAADTDPVTRTGAPRSGRMWSPHLWKWYTGRARKK